jgi:deoxyribodipyrimidine photo-lyase
VPLKPTLLWFRQDLRLQDNPALRAALARGGPVIPVYVRDDAGEEPWRPGGAAGWWLHHSLAALQADLHGHGSRLILARGNSPAVLRELITATGAEAVCWNRRYEPAVRARDQAIAADLAAAGIAVTTGNSGLLHEPPSILNKQGRPFQVFTPFWRTCLALPVAAPMKLGVQSIPAPAKWPRSLALAELDYEPRQNWASGLAATWQPGEAGGAKRLRWFVAKAMDAYDADRNRPDVDGSSLLSPWLHTGEIGPRQIWAAVKARSAATGVFPPSNGARVFLSELGWREFAHHLLFHFPDTPERPFRGDFARFAWAEDPGGAMLHAWQRGLTGYPIVDAGMRQLWRTGWMHNRVRMIVASFLVKHLRLPWPAGAAWFWDTLVDADLANNTLGWQWSAGCGADAAPYFRVFAPVLQGQKFDPEGAYVRRWVPELAPVPTEYLHAPWEAPPLVLLAAGVRLGGTYPHPVVDHVQARNAALAAFKRLRGGEMAPGTGGRPGPQL